MRADPSEYLTDGKRYSASVTAFTDSAKMCTVHAERLGTRAAQLRQIQTIHPVAAAPVPRGLQRPVHVSTLILGGGNGVLESRRDKRDSAGKPTWTATHGGIQHDQGAPQNFFMPAHISVTCIEQTRPDPNQSAWMCTLAI